MSANNTLSLLVSIVLLAVFLSCSTTSSQFNYTDYVKEIKEIRATTEDGLIKGDRAPLTKTKLKYIRYFNIDRSYRVLANVVLAENEEPFELPTYSGITKSYIKYATLLFKLQGEEIQLNVYRNIANMRIPMYRELLFLPYKDVTNSDLTYGGGRYINLDLNDITESRVVLDFNKSYNPWCAYADGFNCPIPPAENHMQIEIKAGEMMYAGK